MSKYDWNDLEKYLSNRNPEATSKKETLNVGFDIINIVEIYECDGMITYKWCTIKFRCSFDYGIG